VTVIATGFGGQRRRRRRDHFAEAPGDAPIPVGPGTAPPPRPTFDLSDDALDVPSFLRDN
jgi:hypothetical protein